MQLRRFTGPMNCVGKRLALANIRVTVATFVMRYNLSFPQLKLIRKPISKKACMSISICNLALIPVLKEVEPVSD